MEFRAAAADDAIIPVISEGQADSGQAAGSPPNFGAMQDTSWQPLQCQNHLLAAMRKRFAASYDAAKNALVPGNEILQVEGELGRGGFGGVYKAFCTTTREMWAIKKPVTVSVGTRGD